MSDVGICRAGSYSRILEIERRRSEVRREQGPDIDAGDRQEKYGVRSRGVAPQRDDIALKICNNNQKSAIKNQKSII
jgi:hypothetical protein